MGKIATALFTGVLPGAAGRLPTMEGAEEGAYDQALDEAEQADLDGENDDTVRLLDSVAERRRPQPPKLLTDEEAWRANRDQELKDEGLPRKVRRARLRKESKARPWRTG